MFEQKRFAGRHLVTFESQKLNYFGKKGGPAFWHYNVILFSGHPGISVNQLSPLSLRRWNIRHFTFDFHRLKMDDSLFLEEVTSPRKREFRQKASGWINKTLLLIKQQKWLSEFCVKIDRSLAKIGVE
jgi:hypothetical protein